MDKLRNKVKKYPGILREESIGEEQTFKQRSNNRGIISRSYESSLYLKNDKIIDYGIPTNTYETIEKFQNRIAPFKSSLPRSNDAQDSSPNLKIENLNFKTFSSEFLVNQDSNKKIKDCLEKKSYRLRLLIKRVMKRFKELVSYGVDPSKVVNASL